VSATVTRIPMPADAKGPLPWALREEHGASVTLYEYATKEEARQGLGSLMMQACKEKSYRVTREEIVGAGCRATGFQVEWPGFPGVRRYEVVENAPDPRGYQVAWS